MGWTLAITRNREALQRIVAALFALAGLVEGRALDVLPRHVYCPVMRTLRLAESAVRRLIIIVAHGMNFGDSLLNSSNTVKANAKLSQEFSKLSPKFAHFCLIDPLMRFNFSSFRPICGPPPRISVPGFLDPVFTVPVVTSLEDPINAKHIASRLLALRRALENLPQQARCLARWQAKRDFERKQPVLKLGRLSPVAHSDCAFILSTRSILSCVNVTCWRWIGWLSRIPCR